KHRTSFEQSCFLAPTRRLRPKTVNDLSKHVTERSRSVAITTERRILVPARFPWIEGEPGKLKKPRPIASCCVYERRRPAKGARPGKLHEATCLLREIRNDERTTYAPVFVLRWQNVRD